LTTYTDEKTDRETVDTSAVPPLRTFIAGYMSNYRKDIVEVAAPALAVALFAYRLGRRGSTPVARPRRRFFP
jgi:hypothetical protein